MRREVAVDLETWVVGGIEGDVEAGPRQAVVACAVDLRGRDALVVGGVLDIEGCAAFAKHAFA
jgi:hypothetical protein